MSTFVAFTPSTQTPFSFQATLSDGNQYVIAVLWNVSGERWYVKVTDITGTLIVNRGLSGSGPVIQSAFTWANGIATVTCSAPHNVPITRLANVWISQTDSGFDGKYLALSTNATTLTYPLPVNPQESSPLQGSVNFALNLLEGYGIAWLLFHSETGNFEF